MNPRIFSDEFFIPLSELEMLHPANTFFYKRDVNYEYPKTSQTSHKISYTLYNLWKAPDESPDFFWRTPHPFKSTGEATLREQLFL